MGTTVAVEKNSYKCAFISSIIYKILNAMWKLILTLPKECKFSWRERMWFFLVLGKLGYRFGKEFKFSACPFLKVYLYIVCQWYTKWLFVDWNQSVCLWLLVYGEFPGNNSNNAVSHIYDTLASWKKIASLPHLIV